MPIPHLNQCQLYDSEPAAYCLLGPKKEAPTTHLKITPIFFTPYRFKSAFATGKKNAHIQTDMRQVYKGEIEEKLSNGLPPPDEDHYRPKMNIKQAFFAFNR